MFGNKNFINKNILIYGLGLSGKSSLKFLSKQNKINIFDDNLYLKKKSNFKYSTSLKEISKSQFDFIVISPGIDIEKCKLKKYLKRNREKIVTELDIFYLLFPQNIKVTITGTNGKSTTCQMLYEIFKFNNIDVRLVGNIGRPPLLEKNIKKKTVFVIEASSYQISYNKYFKANHAAILNLSADHLERHGDINNYARTKLKLIYTQDKNNQSYIEKNNPILKKNIINKNIKSNINLLQYNRGNFFKKKIKNKFLLDVNNLNNIHFVYTICKKFKFSDTKIFQPLNKFKTLKFRKQLIYNKTNLEIINDSKSTSFSSTINLLSTYKNIYWIVGGQHKKGDRFNLNKKYYKNISAYIIGLDKNYFEKQFRNKIKFKYFKNLKTAILNIKKNIKNDKSKKTILFSPSAASFDQFKNFEERGKYFNMLIKKILIK
tara:strand:+ start:242 stop:1534 length:1293 start_codon:yes stop_codon:yes gene_type:complete